MAAAITLACSAVGASAASASFTTGLWGAGYTSPDASVRGDEFDNTVEARAEIARIDVVWRSLVSGQPADPTNPADPAYDFSSIDAAVRDAAQRDLTVMFTVYRAPSFAEGPDPPGDAPAGSWRVDPQAFGDFGRALASRYSGAFQGLPQVRFFEAWNEPNLSDFLSPQWEGKSPYAADLYRRMVNAFSAAIHAVNPQNVVVAGSTAPYGDPAGGRRMRPLRFLRGLLCVQKKGAKIAAAKCSDRADFDVLSHHPINLSGGPGRSAIHPDDASTPDFEHVKRTLRAAEQLGRVKGGRHPVWATELWWESDPPDSRNGINLAKHARWTAEALYSLWKQGAGVVINFVVRDVVADRDEVIDSGLILPDGTRKPAFQAFRFPFVVDRKSKRSALAWGKAPVGGRVVIERAKGGGWKQVGASEVASGKVFTEKLKLEPQSARFRAKIGAETSLAWKVSGK